MSSTWKSLAVGFGAGVISTALYFPLSLETFGAVGWLVSLLYIGYQFYEAKRGS